MISFPISTGEAAAVIGCDSYKLGILIRSNRVAPGFSLGRRAWSADDILRAARCLGLDTPELRNRILVKPAAQTMAIPHGAVTAL